MIADEAELNSCVVFMCSCLLRGHLVFRVGFVLRHLFALIGLLFLPDDESDRADQTQTNDDDDDNH